MRSFDTASGVDIPAPGGDGGTILVGICSCRAHAMRRAAVRETWMRNSPANVRPVFFVGEGEGIIEDDVVVVRGVPDAYEDLPAKVLGFFLQMLEVDSFDWLFKCDDDTYVALARLDELTRLGYEHVGDAEWMPRRRAASGGAGYLLSRRLVELLAADKTLPGTGYEDLIVSGAAMALCDGRYLATRRLCYHSKRYPRWDNNMITSHWLSPERMKAVHSLCSGLPWHVITIRHTDWQDQVEFYEDGTFARVSCDESGVWDIGDDGQIELDWFDLPREKIDLREPLPGPDRIVVRLYGGLGNQMFQYACGLALARFRGIGLEASCNSPDREFRLERFGVTLVPPPPMDDCQTAQVNQYEEGAEERLWNQANWMNGGVLLLDGYFQNERMFAASAREVAGFFLSSLTPRVPGTPEGFTAVGVHVRRGDFVNHPLHDLCLPEYFLTAMERMREAVRRPWFVIVSDDPGWCRRHFAGPRDVHVAGTGDCFMDFETLLGCDAHILSNSTFGWWAAWLAEHVRRQNGSDTPHYVIAPDQFLNGDTWEILPDRWHRLPPDGTSPSAVLSGSR